MVEVTAKFGVTLTLNRVETEMLRATLGERGSPETKATYERRKRCEKDLTCTYDEFVKAEEDVFDALYYVMNKTLDTYV